MVILPLHLSFPFCNLLTKLASVTLGSQLSLTCSTFGCVSVLCISASWELDICVDAHTSRALELLVASGYSMNILSLQKALLDGAALGVSCCLASALVAFGDHFLGGLCC